MNDMTNAGPGGARFEETVAGPIYWRSSDARAFIEVAFESGQPIRSIEIQRIEREGVEGTLVLIGRPSGELDLLHSRHLDYDETWFRENPFTAHMPFGSIRAVEFRKAVCRVSAHEAVADLDADLGDGRRIRLEVSHRFSGVRPPWFVPAPPQSRPFTLRFMYAETLRMLPRGADLIRASIDGQPLRPKRYLLPFGLHMYYDARTGSGLLGAGLCGSDTRPFNATGTPNYPAELTSPGAPYGFTIRFSPDTVDATAGTFTVTCRAGEVATGRWRREGEGVGARFAFEDVRQNWFPGWGSPWRLPLYFIRRLRRRHERWRWDAGVEPGDSGPVLRSRWLTGGDARGDR